MTIAQFLDKIKQENRNFSISTKPAADTTLLQKTEKRIGIKLPDDLIEFYLTTNGLEGSYYLFNIIPLEDVVTDVDNDGEYLKLAEYLIYSETCGLEINSLNRNDYKFFTWLTDPNKIEPIKRKYIANSLTEFISLYLDKGIFGIWGD